MLTSGQCEIIAFTADGGVICAECAEKRLYDGEADGLRPVSRYDMECSFSDGGCSCDDCGDELVEYVPPDDIEEDDWATEATEHADKHDAWKPIDGIGGQERNE